jgi:hypothetical protein
MTESTSFHFWGRLPTEMKLEVLFHNLSNLNVPPLQRITEYNHMEVFDQHVGPYLKSENREFYDWARDAYYRNNNFDPSLIPQRRITPSPALSFPSCGSLSFNLNSCPLIVLYRHLVFRDLFTRHVSPPILCYVLADVRPAISYMPCRG